MSYPAIANVTISRIGRPALWLTLVVCRVASIASTSAGAEPPQVAAAVAPVPPDHAAKMREGLELFRQQVRPVLLKNCVDCHGGKDTESEFNLATREGLLKGGAEGKSKTVIIGNAKGSRLYKLITHADEPKMPEEAGKLSEADINSIARWIDLGAPYDKPLIESGAVSWTKTVVQQDARNLWSLLPLRDARPPDVKQAAWVRTPVDQFVLAKLEAKGVAPNGTASRRVLIRRASLDLLGLPPTPAEVDAFVSDHDPSAYEKLIDRLLASPRYGERWARHWLDVARFAESHGFEHDYDRKYAYHFRDFVIHALNDDMPYDQFLRWQLAGDEMAPHNPLAMMATGFLGAGVFPTQITANEVERTRYDALDDMTATTSAAMLGLSVGCARCHDHKYDPIPQADYYRMLATFTTAVRSEIDLELPPELAVASPAAKTKDKKRKSSNSNKTKVMVVSEGVTPIRHHTQGADFFEKTFFLNRGDCNQKEGEAEQGFLQVLMRTPEQEKHWQVPRPVGAKTSMRRTALANWITDPKAGAGQLAARVIVNRLWQHHFGRGIVATPNDFGKQGDPPSHPELLDYLAARLLADGWRLKPLHKLMMTSAVYMQGGAADNARAAVDPENLLLYRRAPARLDAEAIRDSILKVSGLLDEKMYGPGTLDENSTRRSIYFTVKRSQLTPMMQAFDAPEALVSLGARTNTTVAPQALLLMNSPLVRRASESLAMKLQSPAAQEPSDTVAEGFKLAVGRAPTDAERTSCVAFLQSQQKSYEAAGQAGASQRALADFCQSLFALNEFVYVE